MRVVLSVDMEGASQLRDTREILACCPEYWETGKGRLEADVGACARGLLDGGADEVVVLDNHGGGNPVNVSAAALPRGARIEAWNLFDLRAHGVDATFQVGYHARGGTDGFLSHTYVPGLRLRVGDELISESHGRAWAAGAPLLGIVGNDVHERTLGSLAGTPYLVVQSSLARDTMQPVFDDPAEGHDAIRRFASDCVRSSGGLAAQHAPRAVPLEASLGNGAEQVAALQVAGWRQIGDVEFAVDLRTWADARGPIAAVMGAALAPLLPFWVGDLTTAEVAAAADPVKVAIVRETLVAWASARHSEWFTEPAQELVVPTVR